MSLLDEITTTPAMRPPRMVLLGVEKVGKTTFAASAHKPILIPIRGEEGADEFAIPKFPVAKSYEQVIGCLADLYREEHDFKTVVIDSASAFEPLVFDAVVAAHEGAKSIEEVGGGYGKGYTEALEYWRRITNALDALRNEKGMASIIIGHVKVKRFDDPTGDSYDHYTFDINDRTANMIYRWADSILFARTKTHVKVEEGTKRKVGIGQDDRVVLTQKRPGHPGGGRGVYGRLPYELPLDYSIFMNAVSESAQTTVTDTETQKKGA